MQPYSNKRNMKTILNFELQYHGVYLTRELVLVLLSAMSAKSGLARVVLAEDMQLYSSFSDVLLVAVRAGESFRAGDVWIAFVRTQVCSLFSQDSVLVFFTTLHCWHTCISFVGFWWFLAWAPRTCLCLNCLAQRSQGYLVLLAECLARRWQTKQASLLWDFFVHEWLGCHAAGLVF